MFELTIWRGRCLVVHCGTRETKWLRFAAGKRGADKRPKGYRVEFAPGDGREFDGEGRPWHDEKAAMRQWSLVPSGTTPEARASHERERLGMVRDLELARAQVERDRERAERAEVVVNAKGESKMRKRTRGDMGLPKAPKAAAQLALFGAGR